MRTRSQAAVAAASKELADSLAAGTRVPPSAAQMPPGRDTAPAAFAGVDPGQAPPSPGKPPLFATSAGASPGLSPDYARIVEALYVVDAAKEYEDLERHLEVGEERGDHGTLRKELDRAERNSRRAHSLMLGARLEKKKWELDAAPVAGKMREAARQQLEDEKREGDLKKAITVGMIEDRAIELFRDEWRHQELTREKMAGMLDSLEHLVRAWNNRCLTLRTLLETLRR